MTKGEVTGLSGDYRCIIHCIDLDVIFLKIPICEKNMYDDDGRILRRLYFSNDEMKYEKCCQKEL